MTVADTQTSHGAKSLLQGANDECNDEIVDYPDWVCREETSWGEVLKVDEWQVEKDSSAGLSTHSYRQKNGWMGRDLIHDLYSPVRVMQYYVKYGDNPLSGLSTGGIGTTLTGIVHFTKRAESHRGFCHGGSMTSVLDDVIGWVAFLVTGQCRPWTGYTVQINTNLKRPIPVDSILVVQASIVQIVRRKVSVEASIFDSKCKDDQNGTDQNTIFATAEGLVVINPGVLPQPYDRSSTLSTASSSMSEA